MAAFSQVEASRGALTHDFAMYWQALYLIAHGDLNPYSSLIGAPFYTNHVELIMWTLASLYYLWPHQVLLLWIQDAAAAGGCLVAFLWTLDFIGQADGAWKAWAGPGLALLLLAANPWVYWAIGFDYHTEAIAGLFALLCSWMLYRGRSRESIAWAALLLLCGNVAATYLVGIGLMAFTLGPKTRRAGIAYIAAVAVYLAILQVTHSGQGAFGTIYGYLAGPHAVTQAFRRLRPAPLRIQRGRSQTCESTAST